MTPEERCLHIDGLTPEGGLYTDAQRPVHPDANSSWQVGPTAWKLPPPVLDHLEALGGHLLTFYRALNLLYNQSWRGTQPTWVADYLDRGKPENVVALGRMNRFRQHLPGIIRRLPHVADLGVDAIWLSPIFTSPMADMGYDVSDHRDIDSTFGTMADFEALAALLSWSVPLFEGASLRFSSLMWWRIPPVADSP